MTRVVMIATGVVGALLFGLIVVGLLSLPGANQEQVARINAFFTGLYTLLTLVILAVVGATAVYAYRQVNQAAIASRNELAAKILDYIFQYRNDPEIRALRHKMRDLWGEAQKMEKAAGSKHLLDWATSNDTAVRAYIAKMNNIAWLINMLPETGPGATRDDLLTVIWPNVIREWHCLLPYLQEPKHETEPVPGVPAQWAASSLAELAAYIESHRATLQDKLNARLTSWPPSADTNAPRTRSDPERA